MFGSAVRVRYAGSSLQVHTPGTWDLTAALIIHIGRIADTVFIMPDDNHKICKHLRSGERNTRLEDARQHTVKYNTNARYERLPESKSEFLRTRQH